MITGAQAKIPAVGLSGPNALISGRSFHPPVTADEMNQVCLAAVDRLNSHVNDDLTYCVPGSSSTRSTLFLGVTLSPCLMILQINFNTFDVRLSLGILQGAILQRGACVS